MNVTNKIPNNYKSNCLKLKQVQIYEMPSNYGESTYYNKHRTQHKISERERHTHKSQHKN